NLGSDENSRDNVDLSPKSNNSDANFNEDLDKSFYNSVKSFDNKTSINEIVDTLSGNESSIDDKIQKLYEECRDDDRKNETIDGKEGNNERKNQCKSPVTVRQMAVQD
ncbi:unnamed protein product, partial [Oppiella nova]